MSAQHFWNLSQLLGLFTCRKLANLSQNFVTEMCKQHPETTRRRLCCEKLGTSHDLKALPLVHFWSVLLLKEQMTTSVRKTLKTLVWSAQIQLISGEICPENNHKIHRFFIDWFPAKFAPKIPAKFLQNWPIFPQFCPKNSAKFNFFSTTYQKPWFV